MTTIDIAAYDAGWPLRFGEIGAALRAGPEPLLGDRLTGVHHIGSTSVPGSAAKPIIDVQISIRDFRPWARAGITGPDEPVQDQSREHIGASGALIVPYAVASAVAIAPTVWGSPLAMLYTRGAPGVRGASMSSRASTVARATSPHRGGPGKGVAFRPRETAPGAADRVGPRGVRRSGVMVVRRLCAARRTRLTGFPRRAPSGRDGRTTDV